MPGFPLENYGPKGSAGKHWEGRMAYTEALASTIERDLVISKFTFAWLEDSGWFLADWSYSE